MILRDYQQECHDAVLAAWGEAPWAGENQTFRSVVANLATSAGKTVIAGAIINSVKARGRCLYIADTDELCRQPRKRFAELLNIRAGVEKAGSYASPFFDVVIGSAQSMQSRERLERFTPDHFKYIFVDEAHRGSDRNKRITDYFAQAKVCGMTATAFRARLKDLSDYYETVAFELGVFDLIEDGYIAPLKVLTLPVHVDVSEVKQSSGTDGPDYDKNELGEQIEPYFEAVADLILEHAADRQIVAFLPLIASSQKFVEICRAKGIHAEHVDGQSPDREELIDRFEHRRFQLLSNSTLLSTGWDCPTADCLLNLTPTRSLGLFRQKVGRIVRTLPGIIDGIEDKEARRFAIAQSSKPDALILDLLWHTGKFGLMGPADLVANDEVERTAIQAQISGLTQAENLEDIASRVQEARERELIRAQEEANKLQAAEAYADVVGYEDTAQSIAARLHSTKLLTYQPVMKWESEPISAKQRAYLVKRRIDPASVKDRGHAHELMNLLITRWKLGLASDKVVEALEKHGIDRYAALHCSARRAYEILGDAYPFPFGKHARAGRTFGQVPPGYWKWCAEQPWMEKSWPIVWRRLNDMELVNKEEPVFGSKVIQMFDDVS